MNKKLKQLVKDKWIGLVLAAGIILFVLSQLLPIIGQRQTSDISKKNKTATNYNVDLNNLSKDELSSAMAFVKFKKIKDSFTPKGIPEIYGKELNISFDDSQDAIDKVAVFGPTYGQPDKKITLTGNDLERYKAVGSAIACEYCCGVKTLTKPDGSAACGCAHSVMMRGLAAYLIKNHPRLSNQQILNELTTWKKTFFPKDMLSAELIALEKSGEPGVKEILREFPDFLPKMVGGC